MYTRRDRCRLADGAMRTYLALAHNVWEPAGGGKKGRSRPVVLARLGAEEDLDLEVVAGMRDALDRYLAERLAAAGGGEAPASPGFGSVTVEKLAGELRPRLQPLRFLAGRGAYGLRAIVEPTWQALGLRKTMEEFAGQHDLTWDFERLVFGMVFNRLVDPKSKQACNEWLQQEGYFPEAKGWEVQYFYRAMDLLHDHAEELERAVMRAVRDRLPPGDLKLLLVDTTSSYFESDYDDVERGQIQAEWAAHAAGQGPRPRAPVPQVVNQPPLRMRGHSKDKRGREPQVVIATVCTARGHVMRHGTYPGNRQDQTLLLEMVDKAVEVDAGADVAVVFDAGMGGAPNLEALNSRSDPPHWICAVPVRQSKFGREKVLEKSGKFRPLPGTNFTYRSVSFSAEASPSGREEVWIVTRNELSADRETRKLARHVKRIEATLAQDDRAGSPRQEVCELLSKGHLKRLVTKSKDGQRLRLDEEALRRERKLAGVRLYRSTLVHRDPRDLFAAYQALLGVEDNWRTYKGPLRLRPMYHRADRRIKAHVTICTLALLVLRELELRTGLHFEQLRALLGPVRATLVERGGLRFWQRDEWGEQAEEVLEGLGIRPGPRTWGAHRAPPEEAARDDPG